MLLRIDQVDEFRGMKNWRSSASLRPFARYNVVFGINGSGKSTFASLLHEAQTDATWPNGLRVTAESGESQRTVNSASDSFWSNVRVFDDEFVDRNLRFSKDSASTADSLVVLGEERIGVEDERKRILSRLAEIDGALLALAKEKLGASRSREKLLTDVARTVAEELQGVATRYSPRSYRAPQVRELIERSVTSAPDNDIAGLLKQATAQAVPEVNVPQATEFSFDAMTVDVRTVFRDSALSRVMKEFVDHPDWGNWVERGLDLHHDVLNCIYCGNKIDPTRTRDLERHFDESLRALQARVTALKANLETVRQTCLAAMSDLPSPALLAGHLQSSFKAHLGEAEKSKSIFLKDLDQLIAELVLKNESMFSPMTMKFSPSLSTMSISVIAEDISKHNDYVRNLDANRVAAAEKVENARVASISNEYSSLSTVIEDATIVEAELIQEKNALKSELTKTEVVDLDPLPLAELLNEDIAQLLGRSDLTFAPEGTSYTMKRNGRPASRLSEGERNAIALLYFLRSLEVHGTNLEDCIVIIDDPVSSLDHNNFIGASALLWSRLMGRCSQLILLTHDYELFRTWSYQLRAAKLKKNSFSLYELRPSIRTFGAEIDRTFSLVAWPEDYELQKRLRSEYHYLFWTALRNVDECIENPTPEREAEAAIVLPNVCRRMLEAFLAFREPTRVGNLREQVKEVGPSSIDGALRTRVLRFVHTYSHNEEADISEPIGRPESLTNIRSVLEFMRTIDESHFDSMCEALEVKYHPV